MMQLKAITIAIFLLGLRPAFTKNAANIPPNHGPRAKVMTEPNKIAPVINLPFDTGKLGNLVKVASQ